MVYRLVIVSLTPIRLNYQIIKIGDTKKRCSQLVTSFFLSKFFQKSKNAERRHLQNVVRKRYGKLGGSKSMGRIIKTTYKKSWMNKKQKEDDNILVSK